MLKLYYSNENIGTVIKNNTEELCGTLSGLYKFSEEAQQNYIENTYYSKIACIASNLREFSEKNNDLQVKKLVDLLGSTDRFDSFNPRYIREFDGRWTKKIDEKARLNQEIIGISKKYGMQPTPEIRFIILNALKYISGKDIDNFVLIGEFSEKTDLETLIEISKKKLDYIECPFEADMNGLCHTFAKDNNVYARFSRDEFDIYLLSRLYKKTLDKLEMDIQGITFSREDSFARYMQGMIKIPGGMYSDSAAEKIDTLFDSSPAVSLFITEALKNAARTKTILDFNGIGRDYFLAGISLFADKLNMNNVGSNALSGDEDMMLTQNIDRLEVKKSGNNFGRYSNFISNEIIIKKTGDFALCGINGYHPANHYIGKLTVETAGDDFGVFSNINSAEVHLKDIGWRALKGSEDIFSKHKIKKLTVDKACSAFGTFSEFISDEMILKSVGDYVLVGDTDKFSNNNITKLEVDSAGTFFMKYSNLVCDELYIKNIASSALCGGNQNNMNPVHKIKMMTVEKAGNYLGENSNFNSKEILLKDVGNRALSARKNNVSDHKISTLTVLHAGDSFAERSNFNSRQIILKNVGADALNGGEMHARILKIYNAGSGLGKNSSFHINKEKLYIGEGIKFKGKIKENINRENKAWWKLWM